MNLELERALKIQESKLKELLKLLDEQYKLILSKDIFGLEAIAEEIQVKNREVAQIEIERRKLLGDKSIKEYILTSNNINLDDSYRSINKLLNEMILQKDTNDLLIKQQLSFTNKLLNLINPKRDIPTYNSYGSIKR